MVYGRGFKRGCDKFVVVCHKQGDSEVVEMVSGCLYCDVAEGFVNSPFERVAPRSSWTSDLMLVSD